MSWSDLETDFFEPVCRATFDRYFDALGFSLWKSESTAVAYGRGRCWFKIHHYVEESPRFSPMLTAGMHSAPFPWITSLFSRLGRVRRAPGGRPILFNEVGLWYVIPKDHPASRYSDWRFSSRQELEAVAPRLRDEVVIPWGPRLWDDPRHFETVLADRYRDYVEEGERDRQPADPRRGFAILGQREREILAKQQAADN